jgi:non-heme chloroperoxidase
MESATTVTSLKRQPQQAAAGHEYSFVSDLAGGVRALSNLSGFGRKNWFYRLLWPRLVAQTIALTTAEGDAMSVEVCGTGRPVLLIHGLGGSHHDWDATIERLSRTHRVYTVDLRGHGARAAVDARPTLEAMARDVALVLDILKLDRPLLVGHSMGALVIMQYLRERGADGLGGVCFVDQSPRITTDDQWQLGLFGTLTREQLHGALARLSGDFVGTVVSEALSRTNQFCSADRGLIGRSLRRLLARFRDVVGVAPLMSMLHSLADSDFRDVIGRLSVPTLVVLGGASHHYRGLPLAEYYESALAKGTVTTYQSCAHSPHREDPDRFADDLADFAARHHSDQV